MNGGYDGVQAQGRPVAARPKSGGLVITFALVVFSTILLGLSIAVKGHRNGRNGILYLPTGDRDAAATVGGPADEDTVARAAPPCRLVGVGDVHGDRDNLVSALLAAGVVRRPAGAVDPQSALYRHLTAAQRQALVGTEWALGCGILVQTGDVVDRGDQVFESLDFLLALTRQASAAGGTVLTLNGNHEQMNYDGDYRFVPAAVLQRAGGQAAYTALMGRSGQYGEWMRRRPIAARINGTVFVHGGITAEFAARGVVGINRQAHDDVLAATPAHPATAAVLGADGPIWSRDITYASRAGDCAPLRRALAKLGAQRMVVGHTVEPSGRVGVYCAGAFVALDVGMSHAMQNVPACAELLPKNRALTFYGGRG